MDGRQFFGVFLLKNIGKIPEKNLTGDKKLLLPTTFSVYKIVVGGRARPKYRPSFYTGGVFIFSKLIFVVFSKDAKKPNIIYRWEDQEIYYFSLGIKDFGKDYVKISKIIQTKTAAQLEKFYTENHEKFLLSNSYEEYMEKQGANQASLDADAAAEEPEVIDNEPIDLPCEVTILD